ncbi:adenylosuccinate lyase family protein [Paenibacillus frigoriresistens]|uniref:class-II fumarase/aspartase family protein n=1 Tax=Paenibacillus alginolyticus TaxID=59839 RepID=UPI001566F465|nr:adenylosuccinate lyase family protein [Paenibacillus frigoriresistens]NRF93804.1 adenylosuccinate lyase family protein [Paenibacillus frigoriresistens]
MVPNRDNLLQGIFSHRSRLQRYLDVEAALAMAQAELAIIPQSAADKIAKSAKVELMDIERLEADQAKTGHFMMPLVSELSRVVGEPEGGYVHWGATSQNIEQTGDVLGYRSAVAILANQMCDVIEALATLGEKTADTLMAGRTHWQQAVPITFGLKAASWNDVMIRHLERMEQLKPRLFTSMTGGAAGTFASLGEMGPAVQEGVARRLDLTPMAVPARNIADQFTEFVLLLGMIAATLTSIAEEVSRLMATEFGEVSERLPEGDVGSSTMPQKRNAKKCMEVVIKSASIRSMVPVALEGMIHSHEVDGARFAIMQNAVEQSAILTEDILKAIHSVIIGLEIFPEHMKRNLALSGGLINAEAVMMTLADTIGRQVAHEVVHEAAHHVTASGAEITFYDVLSKDPRVTGYLKPDVIKTILDPASHTGLSAQISRETSARAHAIINLYRTN